MKGDEVSFILDDDSHFHGATRIQIHGKIEITRAPMGTGIRIKCDDPRSMKIIPIGPGEVIIEA
jgi:hypothetical protein